MDFMVCCGDLVGYGPNVGSVGKQKIGDPRARYALIEFARDVSVEFRRVSYPVEDTVKALVDNGLPLELVEVLRACGK